MDNTLLVDHDLEPGARDGRHQIFELLEAEVVGGRHPKRPPRLQEFDGQLVRCVQREVGDERDASLGTEVKPSRIPDQEAVGPLLAQVAEDVGLEGLLDPRCGQVDRLFSSSSGRGFPVSFQAPSHR